MNTTTSPSYLLSDLSFLDNFSEDVRANVLKRLQQIVASEHSENLVSSPEKYCFIETIPIEVRNPIYELPLVNPILGEPASISKKKRFGERAIYRLEPAIIRTCRQISSESSKALYNRNMFFVSTTLPKALNHKNGPTLVSPITQYSPYLYATGDQKRDEPNRILARKIISRVRKWIIVRRSRHKVSGI
jgi:hypothetical protein